MTNQTRSAVLTTEDLEWIAPLCRRSIWEAPSADELAASLFPADEDAAVVGDPSVGVVSAVRAGGQGFVRLLVVAPDQRRQGHGRELLAAAEEWLGDVRGVTLGGDPGASLWPGVPATDVALVCLAESAGYQRVGTAVDMELDLRAPLPADGGGWTRATAAHRDEVAELCRRHAPGAAAAVLRALEADTLLLVHRGGALVAASAFDVHRLGAVGPVVIDPSALEAAAPALVATARLMRTIGHPRAEFVAVQTVRPFAAVGARLGKLFHVYRKEHRA